MPAYYRFTIRFRVPTDRRLRLDPDRFEAQLRYTAPDPESTGNDWRFFREHLWRGELNDPDHFRRLVEERLGVPIEAVAFKAFETDPAYLDALRAAIAADLEAFRADDVDSVLTKYLGSRIEVRETDNLNAVDGEPSDDDLLNGL